MKTIIRIQIDNCYYGDAGAGISGGKNLIEGIDFARKYNLRFGNGVVFAVEDKAEELLAIIKSEGLQAHLDGFSWQVYEPADIAVGAIIRNRYRITKTTNNERRFSVEEIKPRPGYKRCRKHLIITLPTEDLASCQIGIYGL